MATIEAPPAEEQRTFRANVRRFYCYKFLINFQLWIPIWVLYLQRDRAFSLAEITALEIPFLLVGIVAQLPTGALADRWGRRFSLLLGTLGFAVGVFLFGVSTNFWMILAAYAVWGLSMTLGSGSDTAFLHDTLAAVGREEEFSRIVGRAQSWLVAAGLLAALIGAPLAAATNLAFPIVLSSGITLLAGAVVLRFEEPKRKRPHERLAYAAIMAETLRYTLRRPALLLMIVLSSVLLALAFPLFMFVQPFLNEHNVPVGAFGLLIAPSQLFSILGMLGAYRLTQRFGERAVLGAITTGLVAGLLVLGLAHTVWAIAAFPLMRLCTGALFPVSAAYINRHSPDNLRATLASEASMLQSILLVGIEPLGGVLADRTSLETAFFACAIGIAIFGSAAFFAWSTAARNEYVRERLPADTQAGAGVPR
jgi:MFS family permease